MPSEMGKFRIWSVAHVPSSLVAFIVIVLSLAGACNGSDDSSKTTSVIGSVAFDCNACSEHLLAFSGAHVAIKCQRGNDWSTNAAGSVNADGSFAIHLEKVELGDLCMAEVVMPNNKLCSLAKTSAPSTLEKLSVSTPLTCNDARETLHQKFFKIHPQNPKSNSNLPINFPKLHMTPKFLNPKYPLNHRFLKTKPLPSLPPLPPIFKPTPFLKPIFFKPPPPPIFKPTPFPKPSFFKPPPPPIFKPTPFPKPGFFKPPPPPIFKPTPFPITNFFKPPPPPNLKPKP